MRAKVLVQSHQEQRRRFCLLAVLEARHHDRAKLMNAPKAKLSISSLYETDFYAWIQQQAMFLHNQQWSQLDLPNLIEEIESLGKQQCQELRNRLSVLIGHLLKWQYQPQHRSRSWLATLRIQRLDIHELLEGTKAATRAAREIGGGTVCYLQAKTSGNNGVECVEVY